MDRAVAALRVAVSTIGKEVHPTELLDACKRFASAAEAAVASGMYRDALATCGDLAVVLYDALRPLLAIDASSGQSVRLEVALSLATAISGHLQLFNAAATRVQDETTLMLLLALAKAEPCRVLASAYQAAASCPPMAGWATTVVVRLVHLAALSQPFAAVIMSQICDTGVVRCACRVCHVWTSSRGDVPVEPVVPHASAMPNLGAASTSDVFVSVQSVSELALAMVLGDAAADAGVVAVLAAEPAFGTMLMQAAVELPNVPRLTAEERLLVHGLRAMLAPALQVWLTRAVDISPPHTHPCNPTAPQVVAVSRVLIESWQTSGLCARERRCAVATLFRLMDSDVEQQRAFPELVGVAGQMLLTSVASLRAATVTSPPAAPDAAAHIETGVLVLAFFTDLLTALLMPRMPDAQTVRPTYGTTRARYIARFAFVVQADGLVRAYSRLMRSTRYHHNRVVAMDLLFAAAGIRQSALRLARLLPDDNVAASTYLSVLATERKLLMRHTLHRSRTGESDTASDVASIDPLPSCAHVCSDLFGSEPGLSTTVTITTCAALHLVPLMLTMARRAAAARTSKRTWWIHALPQLLLAHRVPSGAAVSAAAGAPALLVKLLRQVAQTDDKLLAFDMLVATVATASSALASSSAWVAPTVRLSLVGELEACLPLMGGIGLSALSHCAAVLGCVATVSDVAEGLRNLVADLARRVSSHHHPSSSCVQQQFTTTTWDAHMMVVARGQRDGMVQKAALGCCNRRCTHMHLDGDTHGLRMCAGCRLARYCGEECQRRAWRSGHRSSCPHRV